MGGDSGFGLGDRGRDGDIGYGDRGMGVYHVGRGRGG